MQSNTSHFRSPIIPTASTCEDMTDSAFLFVANLPPDWNHNKIKLFVIETCKSPTIGQSLQYVTILKDVKNKSKGECLLTFKSQNVCQMAMKLLRGAKCENKKIIVMQDSGHLFEHFEKFCKNKNKNSSAKNTLINETKSVDQVDQHQTYGLSKDFLKYLNISLPLFKRIFVGNLPLDIDEKKLRQLFGYAGHIFGVILLKCEDRTKMFAKIEYDHPVEAVQAISMFHGHQFMNKTLVVKMENNPNAQFKSVGPGLGPNGQPLRGIRYAVEFEPIKQLFLQELAKFKSQEENVNSMTVNQVIPQDTMGIMNNMMNFQNPMGLFNVKAFNPLSQQSWYGLSNMMNSQGTQNLQVLQGLLQQSMGNDLSGLHVQNMPNTAQNLLGNISQNQWANLPQNQFTNVAQSSLETTDRDQFDNTDSCTEKKLKRKIYSDFLDDRHYYEKFYDKFDIEGPSCSKSKIIKESDSRYRRSETPASDVSDRDAMTTSDMLIFTNLPPSVTTKALSNKMSEVGEVKFAEMTGQNKAIVRFTNARDAERCVRLFDRSKVDGQIINVKFL
ncbi:uncharacterized protein LOC113510699 [Galleria mellonella]|uniref:Uncharacterized protein LOC113510699 n=1 Tax=Galleria mellonella TaxID=7137 RepID=A0A6J1WA80_GALME|nr:uncharacterized protein LOC113510699 [Galleria mellonella]